jgi:hypothetical protein
MEHHFNLYLKGTPLRFFDMTGLFPIFVEINFPFDVGLDQLCVCKISHNSHILIFQSYNNSLMKRTKTIQLLPFGVRGWTFNYFFKSIFFYLL